MLHLMVSAGLALLLIWQQTALEGIRPDAIREHLHYLASDALEGRGTGTRGHELAAKYVSEKFQAMGLEPAGDEKSWLQTMTIRRSELAEEEFRVTLNGTAEMLTFGRDFVVTPDALRAESTAEGRVVFAGYGLSHPELKHDDYAGIDVRGKFVVVLSGVPNSFPADYKEFLGSTNLKLENAAARGAIGMISIRSQESERRPTWNPAQVSATRRRTVWYDGSNAYGSYQQLRVVATISSAAARKILGGVPESFGKSFESAATLRVRTKTRYTDVRTPNVVALVRGSDARLRNQYVVYTAHLDHEGIGRAVNGDAIYNGALDNAVSVSMMLEIARAFTREQPKRSVIFVATTAEEEGLLGADYFVHHPPVSLESIVANINMDATLALFPLKDFVALGGEHSTLGPSFSRAASQMGIQVSPDPFEEEKFFLRSDHFQFVLKGIPAMFPSEGINSADPNIDGESIARRWLAQVYHTPKDDLSQPFNYDSMRKQAQLFYLFGKLVANDDQRPRWNDSSFFGKLQKLRPGL